MDNNEKKKHLISFLLDHTSAEFFFRFVDEGHAPHVSKYILGDKNPDGTYSNATICRNVVTTYPSSSANSHPMILTGSFAGKNDLISGQYWNLLGKKPKYVITDKAGLTAIKKYNEKLLSQECKTLFEYFEDSASFHAVNRGANFKILTIPKIITRFLPLLLKMRKKDDPGAVSPIADPELNRELFRKNILDILERTEENNHLWQAMFVVFLLTDQNAHKFGYDSKEYREAIEILDM